MIGTQLDRADLEESVTVGVGGIDKGAAVAVQGDASVRHAGAGTRVDHLAAQVAGPFELDLDVDQLALEADLRAFMTRQPTQLRRLGAQGDLALENIVERVLTVGVRVVHDTSPRVSALPKLDHCAGHKGAIGVDHRALDPTLGL